MQKISAVIITLNEGNNIERCIQALLPVVDEILVVDSHSTDNTTEIANALGARVLYKKFEGFGKQKFFANENATYDWVLNIDADEVLSPELQKSILNWKQNIPEKDGYFIKRLTNFCGAWIRHSGWYPDAKLRLWHRAKGQMNLNDVHEGFEMHKDARIGQLEGDMYHYSFPDLGSYYRKMEHYTELGANEAVRNGRKVTALQVWFVPKLMFFKSYILKLGILDGYYGFVIAKLIASNSFAKYAKIKQKNDQLKNN